MQNSENKWRWLFVAALTETNCEKVSSRLSSVDDAVFHRLFELEGATGSVEERLALEDTMQDIRLLRENSFHFHSHRLR
jgi:hypothetical protein